MPCYFNERGLDPAERNALNRFAGYVPDLDDTFGILIQLISQNYEIFGWIGIPFNIEYSSIDIRYFLFLNPESDCIQQLVRYPTHNIV